VYYSRVIDSLRGYYDGSGKWYDSAGKSLGYKVIQNNSLTSDGFVVKFNHKFDDGTETEARFVMTWITNVIFRVQIADKDVGRGYYIADSCHYYLKTGEAFVEVSYRPTPDGLQVNGSSTKNAEGNYIAWHETLTRR
jgi:hypothetical protein